MNIFEILAHDERVIVFSNEGESYLITWNRSATFQAWYGGKRKHVFMEIGIITCDDIDTFDKARACAQRWFGRGIVDDR